MGVQSWERGSTTPLKASTAYSIYPWDYEYKLPSAYKVFMDPQDKGAWKATVKQAVYSEWTERLQTEAKGMSTMELIKSPELCHKTAPSSLGKHPQLPYCMQSHHWSTATSQAVPTLKIQNCRQQEGRSVLPACKEDQETITHCLTSCGVMTKTRMQYITRILNVCCNLRLLVDPEILTKLILDSTLIPDVNGYETLCRNYRFKIHLRRAVLWGGESQYKMPQ